MRGLSRRGMLISGVTALAGLGGAFGLIEEGVLPGRYRLAPYLGQCGVMPDLPKVRPGPVRQLTFTSQGRPARAVIGIPPGGGGRLPVVVMLHGSAGDARTPFDVYGVQYYLADAVRTGTRPFAVVGIDDWSDSSGLPAPLIERDLLPFLGRQRLAVDRVGVLGWSIGGRGALWLAAADGPGPVPVVAAASPALSSPDLAPLGGKLTGVAVSLTCGADDAYNVPTSDLLARLRRTRGADVTGGIFPGCHDAAFRRRMLPRQLPFLGQHLG
jgi:pimeloyl-ACP methyl ester carboxylesterase